MRPGKPADNANIKIFNGNFRDKCLFANWFLSLDDARDKIEAVRTDYNKTDTLFKLGTYFNVIGTIESTPILGVQYCNELERSLE